MKLILLATVLTLSACGYSSRDSEAIGQIKKIAHQTPIICPNRYDFDLSLGVMRGGVGSMSSQDIWFTVDDPSMLATIKAANESGAIVKLVYDVARVTFCTEDHLVSKVEIVK